MAGEIVINRPIEVVFDFVAGERNGRGTTPACVASGRRRPAPSAEVRGSASRPWRR
jgi:hypothetical protein